MGFEMNLNKKTGKVTVKIGEEKFNVPKKDAAEQARRILMDMALYENMNKNMLSSRNVSTGRSIGKSITDEMIRTYYHGTNPLD